MTQIHKHAGPVLFLDVTNALDLIHVVSLALQTAFHVHYHKILAQLAIETTLLLAHSVSRFLRFVVQTHTST